MPEYQTIQFHEYLHLIDQSLSKPNEQPEQIAASLEVGRSFVRECSQLLLKKWSDIPFAKKSLIDTQPDWFPSDDYIDEKTLAKYPDLYTAKHETWSNKQEAFLMYGLLQNHNIVMPEDPQERLLFKFRDLAHGLGQPLFILRQASFSAPLEGKFWATSTKSRYFQRGRSRPPTLDEYDDFASNSKKAQILMDSREAVEKLLGDLPTLHLES